MDAACRVETHGRRGRRLRRRRRRSDRPQLLEVRHDLVDFSDGKTCDRHEVRDRRRFNEARQHEPFARVERQVREITPLDDANDSVECLGHEGAGRATRIRRLRTARRAGGSRFSAIGASCGRFDATSSTARRPLRLARARRCARRFDRRCARDLRGRFVERRGRADEGLVGANFGVCAGGDGRGVEGGRF